MLQIYNEYTRENEPFIPLDSKRVTLYVCGMTPQDKPHMGHMLAFVSADFVRRVLEYFGFEVFHVQNFTDIDDKIIEKAQQLGILPPELADRNMKLFFDAADALGIRRAHLYPRVTEHIPDIIAFIGRLVEAGHAYEAGGSVYFEIASFPAYGSLSRRLPEDLISGVRIDVDPEKRNPSDFALWKAAKLGEPSWNSPWGLGRPGWHIECSAMSVKYLGETYDLHGGGADLLFPHHENELAQSRALGYPYVKYWFHNGVLNLAGEKMSKSTGNFFAVDDVLKHFTARVLRFYCLYGNLRRARDFNWERLVESQAAFERLQRTVSKLDGLLDGAVTVSPGDTQGLDELSRRLISAAADAERGFRERLADDFDAEGALVQLFELARFVNSVTPELETLESRMSSGVQACWDVFHQAFHILGLSDAAHQIPDIPEEMVQLARERDEARKRRDFATADAIRSQIEHRGYSIGDGPKGTTLRRSI